MSIYAFMVGNLVRDPEVREVNTAAGVVKVCNLTIACSDRNLPRNQDGTAYTEFIRVAAWRGLADICQNYLKKGRKVKIRGTFRQRMYVDNTGVQRAVIEFPNIDDIEMLDRAEQTENQPAVAQPAATTAAPAPSYDAPVQPQPQTVESDDDELPF